MRIGWILIVASCVTEDFDGDGFVEPEDCNDNDADAFPGSEELPYDGIDQDCDGEDLSDVDGDGFDSELAGGADCNDLRADVNPGAVEVPYDGFDQNCDGWSDFDADFDGFEAQGYGGDDCDDTSAAVVPLDFDGDGFTPCTGDCDDNDPFRSPGLEPVCGNGVEDDCDGVSDCAPIGIDDVADAPVRVEAPKGYTEFGAGLALPGDVTGDLRDDLVVTAIDDQGLGELLIYDGPIDGVRAPRTAIRLPGLPRGLVETPDLDGDGLGEVVVTLRDGTVDLAALIPGGVAAGIVELADVVSLTVQAPASSRLDPQVGALRDGTLVLGTALAANRSGRVHLIPSDPAPDAISIGERGAVIEGRPGEALGYMVEALDVNGDGDLDLVIGGLPDVFDQNAVWIVEDPPRTGTHAIEDVATARIALPATWRIVESALMSDVDADGRADLVLGIPAYERRTGAVVALTSRIVDEISVETAPVLIVGLGDQGLGERMASADHDGDGFVDLAIGAPSIFNEGGDGTAPGAVHFFYGPLARENLVSLEDDWRFISDPVEGVRQRLGFEVGFGRLDADLHLDLVFTAPRLRGGVVFVWPGGASARSGI